MAEFMRTKGVRAGDLVEVKSAAGILRTLDACGAAEVPPLVPEPLRQRGRRVRPPAADHGAAREALAGLRAPNVTLGAADAAAPGAA